MTTKNLEFEYEAFNDLLQHFNHLHNYLVNPRTLYGYFLRISLDVGRKKCCVKHVIRWLFSRKSELLLYLYRVVLNLACLLVKCCCLLARQQKVGVTIALFLVNFQWERLSDFSNRRKFNRRSFVFRFKFISLNFYLI